MAVETINAVAGKLNIVIEQGATFDVPLYWKDENGTLITGLNTWTARMHIRDAIDTATTLLELTTENGRITLGATPGEIRLSITDTDTTTIAWESGVYDLELEDAGGIVTRLLKGTVTVDYEVTRQ